MDLINIQEGLLAAVLDALPHRVPIVGNNLGFESDPAGEYPAGDHLLELYFVPATPDMVTVGPDGKTRFTGFLQLNVVTGQGVGDARVREYYSHFANLYSPKKPLILPDLKITFNPVALGVGHEAKGYDETKWTTPITLYWQCDLNCN